MCKRGKSCAIVEDEGFASAFMVAHETGHLWVILWILQTTKYALTF